MVWFFYLVEAVVVSVIAGRILDKYNLKVSGERVAVTVVQDGSGILAIAITGLVASLYGFHSFPRWMEIVTLYFLVLVVVALFYLIRAKNRKLV